MSNILLDLMGVLAQSGATNGVFVDGGTYTDSQPGTSNALCYVAFFSSGATVLTRTFPSPGQTNLQNWYTNAPPPSPVTYQVRATVLSGSPLNIGTSGSYLSLSTNRSFGLSVSTPSTFLQTQFRIDIKDATGPILATGIFTLTATTS